MDRDVQALAAGPADEPVKPKLLAPMARMFATRERGRFTLSTPFRCDRFWTASTCAWRNRAICRAIWSAWPSSWVCSVRSGVCSRRSARSPRSSARSVSAAIRWRCSISSRKTWKQPLSAACRRVFPLPCSDWPVPSCSGVSSTCRPGMRRTASTTNSRKWLSGMTRLSSRSLHTDGEASVPAYVLQALLEQTADGLERMQRALTETERERRHSTEQAGRTEHATSRGWPIFSAARSPRDPRHGRNAGGTEERARRRSPVRPTVRACRRTCARRAAPAVAHDCCCRRRQACWDHPVSAIAGCTQSSSSTRIKARESILLARPFFPSNDKIKMDSPLAQGMTTFFCRSRRKMNSIARRRRAPRHLAGFRRRAVVA